MLAAAAFVSTLVLIEGLPSRGDAAAPAVQRVVLAPKAAVAVAASPAAPAAEFVVKRILPIDGAIKYGEWHWDETDRKSTRLNSSHLRLSRMPSSA